ncbi:nucleolar transcription factor 1-B-like isoform X1 [Lethenteron reissneri]|uniref:nucleolar transcription factor 1-B-like isoform X1 n=1 Tax=Lethenteron reissneri TaxID=7753 RepID=UPI002AB6133F|nr:nucleolar transcription factor 1-B-like isoform X1 [Lethenteron reissneri]XP_061411430.1 nucleolar transcription factor 1-B-like isoform X1 [Lethenteron reissneri]
MASASQHGEADIDSDEKDQEIQSVIVMSKNETPNDGWSQQDTDLLLDRMAACLPADVEKLRYQTSLSRLDWEIVKFGPYNAVQCKEKWGEISGKICLHRTFREIVRDTERLVKCDGEIKQCETRKRRAKALKENTEILDLIGDIGGAQSPPTTAFNLWCEKSKITLLVEKPSMSERVLKKTLSEKWTKLPDDQKLRWVNKALKIQQSTCVENKVKASGKKSDVHFTFINEMFQAIQDNGLNSDLPKRDIVRMILKTWKEMPLEVKRKYCPDYKIDEKHFWEAVPEVPPSAKELYIQKKLPLLMRKNRANQTKAWSIAEDKWQTLSDKSKRVYKAKAKAKKRIYENELKNNTSLRELSMRRKRAPSSFSMYTKMSADIMPDSLGNKKMYVLRNLWSDEKQKADYIKASHAAKVDQQAIERLALQILPHRERVALETMWEMRRKRKYVDSSKKKKCTIETENEVDEEHDTD